jgi:predicted transcriptional regulator
MTSLSREVTAVSAEDSVKHAIELMRNKHCAPEDP